MLDTKTFLYNTLSKKVEEFVPNEEGKVAMYTCGPTVYHFAHIGNLRSYIMEDVLEKHLRFVGYDVKRVMNITDVGHLSSDGDTGEDKMLAGAKREHKSVMDIARFYTDAFRADCEKLCIKWPDVVEPATNCIPEFIHMIEVLLDKGYAYVSEGALVVDVQEETDTKEIPPCIILKSDGASLYSTTDLATIVMRVQDYHPDSIIYLTDQRQSMHFVQVFRCARKTGLVD